MLTTVLQVNVPSMVVDVIESLNAENPDHVRALFQLRLSELQLTLAAEDSLHNVRYAGTLPLCHASLNLALHNQQLPVAPASFGTALACSLSMTC